MTATPAPVGPIGRAYAAYAEAAQRALREAGVLGPAELLEVDPETAFEPNGEEMGLIVAAALANAGTGPVRVQMGGRDGRKIFTVERTCRLELACAGPLGLRKQRLQTFELGLAAVAGLHETQRDLGGACERLVLQSREDGDLPPNGSLAVLTSTIRVRAGDPLGMTETP